MARTNTGINSVGLSVLIFIFITFACFQGARSETNEAAQRRETSSAFAPYWYIDEFTDSFIEIKNQLVRLNPLHFAFRDLNGSPPRLGQLLGHDTAHAGLRAEYQQ
jgi:hypothetical protein